MASVEQWATIDAEGTYGSRARVYHVGSRAHCEGHAYPTSGLQVIDGDGLDVGDTILRVDIPRRAARYRGAVADARAAADERRATEEREQRSQRLSALEDKYRRRGALTAREYAERDALLRKGA